MPLQLQLTTRPVAALLRRRFLLESWPTVLSKLRRPFNAACAIRQQCKQSRHHITAWLRCPYRCPCSHPLLLLPLLLLLRQYLGMALHRTSGGAGQMLQVQHPPLRKPPR